jgi:hypothetical protein
MASGYKRGGGWGWQMTDGGDGSIGGGETAWERRQPDRTFGGPWPAVGTRRRQRRWTDSVTAEAPPEPREVGPSLVVALLHTLFRALPPLQQPRSSAPIPAKRLRDGCRPYQSPRPPLLWPQAFSVHTTFHPPLARSQDRGGKRRDAAAGS